MLEPAEVRCSAPLKPHSLCMLRTLACAAVLGLPGPIVGSKVSAMFHSKVSMCIMKVFNIAIPISVLIESSTSSVEPKKNPGKLDEWRPRQQHFAGQTK